MRRKRLQHVADTMCQMFCGWRLATSKSHLVKLGSGTIQINAVTGHCLFQGEPISTPTIAKEICAWLQEELQPNKIPIAGLASVKLTVKLSFSDVPWTGVTKEIFLMDGKAMRTEKMNRCVMECRSDIETDETAYSSELSEVQMWPIGWPKIEC